MKRLLVVPSAFSHGFRIRSLELASRWSSRYQVYMWRFRWLAEVRASSRLGRTTRQVWGAFRDAARSIRVSKGVNGVELVDAPFLHPALLRPFIGLERAIRVARMFNAAQLERICRRFHVDRVVLANGWVNVPSNDKVSLFWDIVDWYSEEAFEPGFVEAQREWFHESLRRVVAAFVVSIPLLRKLSNEHGTPVPMHYLPNGVDIEAVRRVQNDEIQRLRERLSLQGLWVIGYIGNHDRHAGLDFLLEVFGSLQARVPNIALLIVGPSSSWIDHLQATRSGRVVFTGPLPSHEIPAYCRLQDVAVHPCDKSQFRDYAFPLKVIEATAARKFVISTDLLSLGELKLPNVRLLEKNVELWVRTLQSVKEQHWRSEWDKLVEPFEWGRLAEMAADWMDQSAVHRPKEWSAVD